MNAHCYLEKIKMIQTEILSNSGAFHLLLENYTFLQIAFFYNINKKK